MTLEEFAALKGREIGVSSWIAVSQDRIDAFADAIGDHQYIHVDPERARNSPFGGTIAHGFLTLSLMSQMSYEAVPEVEGQSFGVNYGLNRVRFLAPVRTGSRVRGRFVLDDIDTTKPGEFTIVTRVTVEIEGEDKPAMVADWIGRWYMAPG